MPWKGDESTVEETSKRLDTSIRAPFAIVAFGLVAAWICLLCYSTTHMYGNGPGTFAALILLCGLVVVARYVSPLRSSSPRVNNGLSFLAIVASVAFLLLHFNAFAHIYKMAHGSDFPVDTLAAAQHEFDLKENPYATKSQLMFDPSNAPHVTNENGQLEMFGVPYYYGYAYFPAMFMSYEPFRWLESSHRYIRIGNAVFLFVILGAVGWLTSLLVPRPSRVLAVSLSIAATICALGLAREYFFEGATDVVIPMFTLLGFVAAYYKRPSLAGCLLGWAFACKLLPGAFFCLIVGGWYWRQDARWKFWIAMVGTFAAVLVPHVLRNPPAFFSATILYYLTQHAYGNDTSLYFVLPPQVQGLFLWGGYALVLAVLVRTLAAKQMTLLGVIGSCFIVDVLFMSFSKMIHDNYLLAVWPLGAVALVGYALKTPPVENADAEMVSVATTAV